MHRMVYCVEQLHGAQVQQSGVLGAGASEERGETARMVNYCKADTMQLCPGNHACNMKEKR